MRKRRIYKVHHNFRGWRTSLSRANSSQVYHTSYPILVHRPALSDWPSFRPRLATTPLACSLPSAPRINTWSGDLHPGSHMPCLAHTLGIRAGGTPCLLIPWFYLSYYEITNLPYGLGFERSFFTGYPLAKYRGSSP